MEHPQNNEKELQIEARQMVKNEVATKEEAQVQKSREEGKKSEEREVMRGTVKRRTTTTLIKEEKSSINQQTVRVCVNVYVHVLALDLCECVHSSGCGGAVCTS